MSVQVKLNGEPRELPDGSTVAQAVAELTAAPGGSMETARPEIRDAMAVTFRDFVEQVKTLKVLV